MNEALRLEQQTHDTRCLIIAYMALLNLPAHRSLWRAKNQSIYAALREAIAEATGRDEQSVQDEFEFALILSAQPE